MWDDTLVTRVRDRKLNEIMVFASMAKIDSANVDTYIDIIVSLGDDIDACDTLLDTEGEAEIELEAIVSDRYLERLSPGERADEDAFNAMKVTPETVDVEEEAVEDYVRRLIADAVDSLKGGDAVSALKDELSSCRARIETLSKELEFAREEKASLEDELRDARDSIQQMSEQGDRTRAQLSSVRAELEITKQKLEILEPAYQEAVATIEGMRSEPPAPEEVPEAAAPAETPAEEAPEQEEAIAVSEPKTQGGYLSRENVEAIRAVREMKDSKVDLFLDMAIDGRMDVDVCDGIVDFLKTDVAICDAILSIDFSRKDSVIAGFRRIMDVVQESSDPVHQDEYVATLTEAEAQLEYGYSRVLNSLQGMMMYMRDDIAGE